LPGLYKEDTSKIYDVFRGIYWKFGKDVTWWASLLIIVAMPIMLDFIIQIFRVWIMPTDVDEFQILEKNTEIRRSIENEAYVQMQQGWEWPKDEPAIKRFIKRRRQKTLTLDTELPPDAPSTVMRNTSTLPTVYIDGEFETEVLPSGKLVKRRIRDSGVTKLGKKLRFVRNKEEKDEFGEKNIEVIIQQRMKDSE
jgi:hypothetical protein